MATFVLVHGGGHRAWHWKFLIPRLEVFGHTSFAAEVPMDDPTSTASEWASVIVAQISRQLDGAHDIVLVGHSVGGLAATIVADRLPLRRLVLLCANIPEPGRSFADRVAELPYTTEPPVRMIDDQGRFTFTWEVAREAFYADCDEALARAAWEHLVPSAAYAAQSEICPLVAWPKVPTTSILCTEDRIIDPSWSRRVSLEQFGVPALELGGSHSPFLSRPGELAAMLNALAEPALNSPRSEGVINGKSS